VNVAPADFIEHERHARLHPGHALQNTRLAAVLALQGVEGIAADVEAHPLRHETFDALLMRIIFRQHQCHTGAKRDDFNVYDVMAAIVFAQIIGDI